MMSDQSGKNAQPTRRRVLQGIAGSTAALATGARVTPAFAQAVPIKVACLNVFTGTFTTFGETTFNGLNLYFDQIGWKSAGRKIELLREDDQMSPQIGLEKVRKLVESDKVDIICGPLGSNVALAMINYMKAAKCIWIVTGAGATGLSWAHLPYMFR
ncbi:MAG TPA: ABC transporter substrate-binding protein, partial [Sphingomicrobium sp.]